MMTQEVIKTDYQEKTHRYAQKLVSRFADRESIGETAEDLVLEIIGEGKGRKGKPTKQQLTLAARCLVSALPHDSDYQQRAAAVRMLDELPLLPGVERALIKALRDPSVRVRGYAARAIWKLNCTSAVQPLLDLLTGEESDKARAHATQKEEHPWRYSPDEYNWLDYIFGIKALGILGDQRAVEPLLAYLRRLPPHIFDPEAFRLSLESPSSFSSFSWEPPDEPVWHKSAIRVRLIDALGKLRDPRATETLCEFLADSHGHISCAAASALKNIQDRRAIDPLINMLVPSHPDLHKEIREALLSFAGDELVEKLIAALPSDSENLLRSGIIPILGDLQATQAIELLLARLSTEKNVELCASIVLTLGKLGALQAKEPLYLLLQQFDGIPEPQGRYNTTNQNFYSALFFVLAQLGDTRVLDLLLQAILHKDDLIQSRAIDGLIALDPQRAVEALISLLRNWKPEKESGPHFELSRIIYTLTELEDKRAGEPLLELLAKLDDRQKYRFERYKIIKALGKLGDQPAVEPLMTVFQQGPVPEPPSPYIPDREDNVTEQEYSAEALGNLGDPRASKLLRSYLKNRSQIRWDIANYVIKALGQLGDPAALPEIRWVLRFASNKILELSPKARWEYRVFEIKNKALMAISSITKIPLEEDLIDEIDHKFDLDDL